ncbi:response regulator [Anaeromicropila herbilytica]|uniref:Stage 0 sporulation protein A homolog n=1 Tax=Anaeromicropila herbilytica TaxID=2785025 RepID=A0A7R7EKL9_9FIRM|nr:response regulator [Anaeromicropila herbilytica]BCN30555.1 DNA-binding response regulator [Anaeromicropila herbilytica]
MIKIILLDKNIRVLERMAYQFKDYDFLSIVGIYTSPKAAVEFIKQSSPHAVFLDVNMKDICGIEIAKEIKATNSNIQIVFVSKEKSKAFEAFEIHALDYITKPINKKRLDITVSRLKEKCSVVVKDIEYKNKLSIQCFGKFQIYQNKEDQKSEYKWRTKKEKELLAFLIYNYDKNISKDELASILYNGVDKKKASNNIYVTMSGIRKKLKEFEIERSELKIHADYSLTMAEGICDYIDFDCFFKRLSFIDETNVFEIERKLLLYKGLFLEEEEYAWCHEIRQHLDIKYEQTLFSLAFFYKEKSLYQRYEKILHSILLNNPLSVQAMVQLLELYFERKKFDMYRKQYVIYKEILMNEFNEIPLDKFSEYYLKMN